MKTLLRFSKDEQNAGQLAERNDYRADQSDYAAVPLIRNLDATGRSHARRNHHSGRVGNEWKGGGVTSSALSTRPGRIGSWIGRIRETFSSDVGSRGGFAPPTLGSGTRSVRPFRFATMLPKGVPYQIQAASDLKHWVTIATGVATEAGIEYVDSQASNYNHRFYRVVANEVHSANILGYASTTLPPGFSMIANPFDPAGNTIAELIKGWPDGTTFNKFDTRLFRLSHNVVKHGKWTNPVEKLVPGEGGIFFNPTSDYKSLNFAGDVLQGNLSMPIPAGFSVRSPLLPQPGQLDEDLGFPVGEGDVLHLFDRDQQNYVLYPFAGGKWTSGPPVVNLCESFWVAKTEPANWAQAIQVIP